MTSGKSSAGWRMARRSFLVASGATIGSGAFVPLRAHTAPARPDLVVPIESGVLAVTALGNRAFRVRITPRAELASPPSEMFSPPDSRAAARREDGGGRTRLVLPHARCEWDPQRGALAFMDGAGEVVLREAPDTRRIAAATVGGESNAGRAARVRLLTRRAPLRHRLLPGRAPGVAGLPRRLTQVNTQISLPFILSSKGYGLLWHNRGMAELNMPQRRIALARHSVDSAATEADVTTSTGNARVERRDAEFVGELHCRARRTAFLPARHWAEDGLAPLCRDRWPAGDRIQQPLASAHGQHDRRTRGRGT